MPKIMDIPLELILNISTITLLLVAEWGTHFGIEKSCQFDEAIFSHETVRGIHIRMYWRIYYCTLWISDFTASSSAETIFAYYKRP